mgnify:CR=1 FL=1
MSDSQITIFYSWQSDLPGSETRNIIQDSIKDAVRLLRDTVDIEADRDTKGEFGSPDIAQTIFSKIDDCDIFVADVSAVCRYEATLIRTLSFIRIYAWILRVSICIVKSKKLY